MAQSLSNVLLHIIFSTKNREPFIDEKIQPLLYAYMTGVISSLGSYVHKMGGVEDHVHIYCTLPRTVTISDLLEETKKNSSKWIKTKDPKFQGFSWQKGFGVFSINPSLHLALSKYIENQRDHHKKKTFQDEYREFMRLYNIPYDEKYIWD